MQNLEVGNKTKEEKKNQNNIDEIKKDLNKSIVNGKKLENKNTENTARMVEKPEDVAAVIRQCEDIVRSKQ